MEQENYFEEIAIFANDFSSIRQWFMPKGAKRTPQEIFEMYDVIIASWQNLRSRFPNKWVYKTVRRLFIKQAVRYFAKSPDLWPELPEALCLEMLSKANQGWLSGERNYKKKELRGKSDMNYAFWKFLHEYSIIILNFPKSYKKSSFCYRYYLWHSEEHRC